MDVESCYTALLDASACYEAKLISKEHFEEMRVMLPKIALKYAQICWQGKLRADDLE